MQSLDNLAITFQNYLEKYYFEGTPKELYEPVNYILSLGGKRLRPLLALMGCDAFGQDIEQALPIAMAVEVFHNFTLLHDDIMDAAPLRRGKPTVHTKFGTNVGILSGDVMMIYAYKFLHQLEKKELLPPIYEIFNQMAIEVCEGQQMDMNFETRQDVSLPEYVRMIECKTSVLLAAALQMGALVGGSTAEDAQHLAEFGRHTGIAFQIQDDILDTFGDAAKFGKKVGGDIIQNKKTFLVLKTLEIATPSVAADLGVWFSQPTENQADELKKIEAVRAIFEISEARAHAEKAMREHLNTAFSHLDAITQFSENTKNYFRHFAEWLIAREH
jgi:geranylgeranyl diphosphate synthase type II